MKKERLQQKIQEHKGEKKDYCEQLYGNKINNPGEMDRFLETDRQD